MTDDATELREALKQAIRDGDISGVEEAVTSGAPTDPNEDGETPLMHAALCGRLPVVRLLVEEVGQQVNATGPGGATALIRGAISGNLDVVRYLVDKGADLDATETPVTVNARGLMVSTGWETHTGTALIAAVAVGSLDIVRFLLECGADPRRRNGRGHDAFDNAVRYNRPAMVDLLLERLPIAKEAGFLVAARFNLNQAKRFVEELGVNAACADGDGTTALMVCASEGDYEYLESGPHPGPLPDHVLMATYLIGRGCPVNAQNRAGQTALMFAAARAESGLMALLVQSGADPNARDHQGKAAVDYVAVPPEPPEDWENAHEAWCWEAESVSRMRDFLASAMQPGSPSGHAGPAGRTPV